MPPRNHYRVNEVFCSPQGEGYYTGDDRVFIRFTGCNLRCDIAPGPRSPGGFKCDTEFTSGRFVTLPELREWVEHCAGECRRIVLTGGEPALQVDAQFCEYFHQHGYELAMETNGTVKVAAGVDWISLAPKVADHALEQRTASEVKFVRGYGQALPKTTVRADHYYISPAFAGDRVDPDAVEWCKSLVANQPPTGPQWELMAQMHKVWEVR